MTIRYCVYCEKTLTGRKLKYCNDLCKYRFISIKNDKIKDFSKSQHLRLLRAGRSQSRSGVRYN